jgi:hypothetical protein
MNFNFAESLSRCDWYAKTASTWKKIGKKPAGPVGFEPTTYGLEIRCSIQLSYDPVITTVYTI